MSHRVAGWGVFKTLVYSVGFTYACWIIFQRCLLTSEYLYWTGADDLGLLCNVTAGVTWAIWTFGVGCIIVEGMKEGGM